MNESLKGKRVLIVGGSSGIGLSVAKRAAAESAQVLVASRTAENKRKLLKQEIDEKIEAYSLDITSKDDLERLFREAGNIDHLAVSVRPPQPDPSDFSGIDIAQVKAAFEIKFWGLYQLIQSATKCINAGGSIAATSGIAGEKIYKGASTMAIINSATEVLCRSLAVELAPIRVNTVSPGFIAPKPQPVQQFAEQFPSGIVGQPEAVADAFIYLMKNQYVTGSTVVVDGGAKLV